TTLTTLDARRTDIITARDWMLSNGFDEGAKWFIVPGGWDQRDDHELVDEGTVDVIWYAGNGDPARGQDRVTWPIQRRPYRLTGGSLIDGLTDYIPSLDSAMEQKRFWPVFGHNINVPGWTAFCAAIAERRDA